MSILLDTRAFLRAFSCLWFYISWRVLSHLPAAHASHSAHNLCSCSCGTHPNAHLTRRTIIPGIVWYGRDVEVHR